MVVVSRGKVAPTHGTIYRLYGRGTGVTTIYTNSVYTTSSTTHPVCIPI